MATQIVELTGDEQKLIASLRKAQAAEQEHIDTLKKMGAAGQDAGKEIGEGLGKAAKNPKREFQGLLRELRSLGPEGRKQAQAIRDHWRESGAAGERSMQAIRESLAQLDPAAAAIAERVESEMAEAAAKIEAEMAESAAKIEAEMAEADRNSQFKQTLVSLRSMGDEGKAIADGIEADLKAAAVAAAGGLDGVLGKLKELDPAAAESAERIRIELAAAADSSEDQFNETLASLRAMGPVGRQVAEELKQELVTAGKLSEASIDDVVASLRKIDPAAADAAAAIHRKIDDAAKKGESSFARFGTSAIGQITAVAGAYVGVQEAIQAVNGYLKEQEQLLQSALDKQLELAKAQQEAVKNLAGLNAIQQNELLQEFVPDVARSTGFSDLGALTTAVGAGVSAGGSVEDVQSAVLASAELTRQSPQAVDEYAAAAIDLRRATGSGDARENLGFLLAAGTQSRVVDPEQLAKNLSPAVVSGASSAPDQDRAEAAREAAAVFGVLTKSATDTQGASTSTATIQLLSRMKDFFEDPERKSSDPRTIFGRLEALQSNDELRSQFFEKSFGEARFQQGFKDLADGSSELAAEVRAAKDAIRVDRSTFDSQIESMGGITPAMRLARVEQQSQANLGADELEDVGGAALAQVRGIVAETRRKTNDGNIFSGAFDSLLTSGIARGGLSGSTASAEALAGIADLQSRRDALFDYGLTAAEERKAEFLEGQINALADIVAGFAGQDGGDLGSLAEQARGFAATREIEARQAATPALVEEQAQNRAVFERLASVLERLAEERSQPTRGPQSQPATGAALAGARAQLNN